MRWQRRIYRLLGLGKRKGNPEREPRRPVPKGLKFGRWKHCFKWNLLRRAYRLQPGEQECSPKKSLLQRIYRLLQADERKRGIKVACAVCFAALLDFAGLAALLPVLFFLLGDDGHHRSEALLFCLGAVLFILIKNTLILRLTRYQNQFLLSLYRRISKELFAAYYRRGFLFIRREGSMKLGYEVNYECYAFCLNVLGSLLRMAADGLLVVLVMVAFLIYSPSVVGILCGTFLPLMLLFVLKAKKHIRFYGEQEWAVRREQSRLVQETFRGYTELELNRAFPFLEESFTRGLDKISTCRLRLETAQRLPAGLLELSVVMGLAALLFWGGADMNYMLGVFALAAFRLLPALRTLLFCWTSIQNSARCLDCVEAGLRETDETERVDDGLLRKVNETDRPNNVPLGKGKKAENASDVLSKKTKVRNGMLQKKVERTKSRIDSPSSIEAEMLPFEQKIEVRHLSFGYPDGRELLHDFHYSIEKGTHLGIRGASGIGKSTLFYLLLGFLSPSSGEICVDGATLSAAARKRWLRRVGYVAQDVFILNGTLAENIALGQYEPDREKIEQVLRDVELWAWRKELPQGLDTPLGEGGAFLSGGQKQRIGIARALYKEADVLLLDEAISALDSETESAVNCMLRSLRDGHGRPLTLLSIAHRERSLAYCTKILNLEDYEEKAVAK